MRNSLILTLSALTLMFTSCSKDSEPLQEEPVKNTVIKLPDSVVIGTQKWTTVNYNGSGGQNFQNGNANNPTTGKYYTLDEAKTFILPKGWRIPTAEDFTKLCYSAGATAKNSDGYAFMSIDFAARLMASTGWYADAYIGKKGIGFNAVPTGYYSEGSWIVGIDNDQPITFFLTTSTFMGNSGGPLNFCIYQIASNKSNQAVYTSLKSASSSRASLRFVKDL